MTDARTIIESVEGLEGDVRASLVSHGLADGSADMRLKMAAFDAAVRASASHAIPVAGAYSEIKDSAEAGISLLTKGIRKVSDSMCRFRRAGRSEPQPAATEE